MEVYKRSVVSASSTGYQTASIPLGTGTWEILTLSVSIGGGETIVAAMPVHMAGNVVFEQTDQDTTSTYDLARSIKLTEASIVTEHHDQVMQGTKIVVGGGWIKSQFQHAVPTGGFEHTMAVTYRRVYP